MTPLRFYRADLSALTTGAGMRELFAWNIGVTLAAFNLLQWWDGYGRAWWRERVRLCRDCGRTRETCSCVDVIFTPDFDLDDEGDD